MKKILYFLIFIYSFLIENSYAQYVYKPNPGDKFIYRVSKKNKSTDIVFVFDLIKNSPVFYWKSDKDNPLWGSLFQVDNSSNELSSNINDTFLNQKSNLIFLNKESFKIFKLKKKINTKIDGKNVAMSYSKSEDYNLPVYGALFTFKLITIASSDKRYSLSFIDNIDFPIIVSLIADAVWQLKSITPLPLYPIAFDITGKTMNDKSVFLFKNYTLGTCTNIKAEYSENFKTIIFDEYFCPITGIRFTLKNDTIESVILVGKNGNNDGYDWKSFNGFFWGVYYLGTSKEIIEKKLGKADSVENGKYFYQNQRFYLIYNSKNELEYVEYE